MRLYRLYIVWVLPSLVSVNLGCVEPFDAPTEVFENVLVVDGLLTDEDIRQRVILTRAFRFEEGQGKPERDAEVIVIEDSINRISFLETHPGIYTSPVAFSASPGSSYRLSIDTSTGESYVSDMVRAPEPIAVVGIYAEPNTDDFGVEGVSIFLDNVSSSNQPRYYRFEYDEAYKIIAPDWDPFEFDIIDDVACADGDAFEVGIKPRTEQKKVCYNTVRSTRIIQATTVNTEENEISRFPVRFIDKNNYILTHRYSILVRQFAQTPEAHSYYRNLDNFSSSESVFSEIQPGFLEGNIRPRNSSTNRVIGYFEVASVSERRLFFSYSDMFPDAPLPEYPINCNNFGKPQLMTRGYHCDGPVCDGDCKSPLIDAIKAGLIVFVSGNKNVGVDGGPYLTKPAACGDCTKLGSSEVPDFWVDKD